MPTFPQTLLKGSGIPKSLEWQLCSSPEELTTALSSLSSDHQPGNAIGLAIHTSKKAVLEFVGLAVDDRIFVIKTGLKKNKELGKLFMGEFGRLGGFEIVRLALYIKGSLGYDVRGYNLPPMVPKNELSPGSFTREILDPNTNSFSVDNLWDFNHEELAENENNKKLEFLCFRAWISARLTSHSKWSAQFAAIQAADTGRLTVADLNCIYTMAKELDIMDAAKPRVVNNDFGKITHNKDGSIVVHNERFKSRIRKSNRTKVVMIDANGKKQTGKASHIAGKQTTVQRTGSKAAIAIEKICVQGREELTNAERACNTYLLRLLQGLATLSNPEHPFVGFVWFPVGASINLNPISQARLRTGENGRLTNQSQADVVEAMIDPSRPLIITHGPPGTGKTTTISVAMRELSSIPHRTAWVVAQSNVGVKNIAESLCKHDVRFKLIVSKEFYVEWHEHLYGEVEKHLIRIDKLPEHPKDVEYLFHDIRIVLSTISTLSNPALTDKSIFKLVPLETLVIDEASQISIFDYLHVFGHFKELRKVCFFGDPKQLPPYGKDSAPSLKSIYDVAHLKQSAYFLDTQYRMPITLGDFISQAVYSSKLKSNPEHPVTGWDCIKLVDVWNGDEERMGTSWKNLKEVQTIVHLVRSYYSGKDFCIITPYDGQRNAIQKALKEENLPWETVFNVDSFQGNEAKYVLVSVVRTTSPGFLKSQNRVNVMLTRCKSGMVIVSKRQFMRYSNTRKTLLGKLATHWEEKLGKGKAWCKWTDIAEKKVNLPGAPRLR